MKSQGATGATHWVNEHAGHRCNGSKQRVPKGATDVLSRVALLVSNGTKVPKQALPMPLPHDVPNRGVLPATVGLSVSG